MSVTVVLNDEMNGIELCFDSKPSDEIREQLKIHRFRWSRRKKIWYAKQTPEHISFAKSLSGKEELETSEPYPEGYPEIDIDDLDSYTVPKELIKEENDSHWTFRNKDIDWNAELHSTFDRRQKKVIAALSTVDDDQATIYYLKKALQSFKKYYYKAFMNWLSYRASNPPWTVTGRGNLNVYKYNKKQDKEMELLNKVNLISNKFEEKYEQILRRNEKNKRMKVLKAMNEMSTDDMKFKVSKVRSNGIEFRCYVYDNYAVSKNWGCWRVYKNGKEIDQTLTTGTLKEAKKMVAYYLKKDKEKTLATVK